MRNLIDIFHIIAKYHSHEGVYFTGPSPEEMTPEDLEKVLSYGAEWMPNERMWKRTIQLSDVALSHLEDAAITIRENFAEIKNDLAK